VNRSNSVVVGFFVVVGLDPALPALGYFQPETGGNRQTEKSYQRPIDKKSLD
jgi:hypothetical protein